MKFSIEGTEYTFDDRLTVEESMLIHEKSKVGMAGLFPELRQGNPFIIAALVFIAKKRAGEAVRWQDIMSLDLFTFRMLPDDEPTPDEKDAKEPDPTSSGSGKNRKRGTTAI